MVARILMSLLLKPLVGFSGHKNYTIQNRGWASKLFLLNGFTIHLLSEITFVCIGAKLFHRGQKHFKYLFHCFVSLDFAVLLRDLGFEVLFGNMLEKLKRSCCFANKRWKRSFTFGIANGTQKKGQFSFDYKYQPQSLNILKSLNV